MKSKDNIVVFSLSSSKRLTKEVCDILGIEEGKITVTRFADGEVIVEPQQSIRKKTVFIIQSTCNPVNENLMELLVCLDAVRRSSCTDINVVIPYYGYARQDRQAKPRQPVTSRLVADLLVAAGATRVVLVDLHAAQIQSFFNIPTDHLRANAIMAQYFNKKHLEDVVVVSPDHGGVTRAREMAVRLGNVPIAIVDKRRTRPNVAEAMNLIGDVKDKNVIIIDDIVDTGGSLVGAVNMLKENGAKDVYFCATHGVLSHNALDRIEATDIKEFIITNTIELSEETEKKYTKLKVLSIATLLAKSIEAITDGTPMSDVYDLFVVNEDQTTNG